MERCVKHFKCHAVNERGMSLAKKCLRRYGTSDIRCTSASSDEVVASKIRLCNFPRDCGTSGVHGLFLTRLKVQVCLRMPLGFLLP